MLPNLGNGAADRGSDFCNLTARLRVDAERGGESVEETLLLAPLARIEDGVIAGAERVNRLTAERCVDGLQQLSGVEGVLLAVRQHPRDPLLACLACLSQLRVAEHAGSLTGAGDHVAVCVQQLGAELADHRPALAERPAESAVLDLVAVLVDSDRVDLGLVAVSPGGHLLTELLIPTPLVGRADELGAALLLLLGLVFAVPPVADGTLDVIDELELGDVLEPGHQTVLDTHETLPEGLKSVRDLGRDALKHGALDEVPGAPLVPGQHLTEDADGVHEDVVDVAEQAEPAFLDDLAVRELFLVRADEALPDATEEVGLLLADDLAGLFVDLYVVAEEVRPDGLTGGLDAVSKPRGCLTDGPACLLRHFPHLAGGLDDGVPVLDRGADRGADAGPDGRADAGDHGADHSAHATVFQHRAAGLDCGLCGAVFHAVCGVFDQGAADPGDRPEANALPRTTLQGVAHTAGGLTDYLASSLRQAGSAPEQAAEYGDELALGKERDESADPTHEGREEGHQPRSEPAEAGADAAEMLLSLLASGEEAGLPLHFLDGSRCLGGLLPHGFEAAGGFVLHAAKETANTVPDLNRVAMVIGDCAAAAENAVGCSAKFLLGALHSVACCHKRSEHSFFRPLQRCLDAELALGQTLGHLGREEAHTGTENCTDAGDRPNSSPGRSSHNAAAASRSRSLSRSPRTHATHGTRQVATNDVYWRQLPELGLGAATGHHVECRADGIERHPSKPGHNVLGNLGCSGDHLAADLD